MYPWVSDWSYKYALILTKNIPVLDIWQANRKHVQVKWKGLPNYKIHDPFDEGFWFQDETLVKIVNFLFYTLFF